MEALKPKLDDKINPFSHSFSFSGKTFYRTTRYFKIRAELIQLSDLWMFSVGITSNLDQPELSK